MSPRERPLPRVIDLRALHFAAELAWYQRCYDKTIDRMRAEAWRRDYESEAEYGRRINGYRLEEHLRHLEGGLYLAETFGGNVPVMFSEPIHTTPARYFEDQIREQYNKHQRREEQREVLEPHPEPQDGAH